jgi:hypothetical protein
MFLCYFFPSKDYEMYKSQLNIIHSCLGLSLLTDSVFTIHCGSYIFVLVRDNIETDLSKAACYISSIYI